MPVSAKVNLDNGEWALMRAAEYDEKQKTTYDLVRVAEMYSEGLDDLLPEEIGGKTRQDFAEYERESFD